ncbi:MAG: nucleotidyltransferase domain-containing protein [Desulfobacterales bacterium]|nr:nucleotidyltransferase domain-containing protein [Desulfobacterales bacterium]
MKNTYFQISESDKKIIMERLRYSLEKWPNLLFAYVYGSFVMADKFRDIDIAVYLKQIPSTPLHVELELETELGNIIKNYLVDVRILNNAPLSFRYNVIKSGKPIVVVDDDARTDFEEATLSNYFDFSPFRKMYLKETLGHGI